MKKSLFIGFFLIVVAIVGYYIPQIIPPPVFARTVAKWDTDAALGKHNDWVREERRNEMENDLWEQLAIPHSLKTRNQILIC